MYKLISQIILFAYFIVFLSGCSNGSDFLEETSIEIAAPSTQPYTRTYTIEPTNTVTPQPTATRTITISPTPTITPTPSPTQIAGVGGIVSFCDDTKKINGEIGKGEKLVSGYYFFDLTSMEYRLLEQYTLTNWDQNPAKWKSQMLLKLKMKGVSDDFLARIPFPRDFSAGAPQVLQVSSDGDEILFYHSRRLNPGVFSHEFILVTSQNSSWKKLDTANMERFSGGITVQYSDPNNQVIMTLQDENKNIDLYLFDMENGQVTNLTGIVDDPVYDGRWSPDGSMIAFSTNDGIWVISGLSEPVLTIPGGLSPEWSPDSQTLVYKKDGGYYLSDWNGADQEKLNLLDIGASVYRVQWVPDGKNLIFWSYYNKKLAWFVANLAEETITPILTEVPYELRYLDAYNYFTWSPDQHWFWGSSMGENVDGSLSESYVCNLEKMECYGLTDHPNEIKMRCNNWGLGAFWPAVDHP